jgi:beta-glucosidase
MSERKEFPHGFFWGAGTSAFQVEGGIENMDWAKAAREGRVPEIGRACDHYNRYEADFDIAKSLGHNAHRFSIEWARIEPEEGKFDEREIEHYRDVLRALRARGIEPHVTLWHFTLPLWFSESGGFERKDAPEIFARYCGYLAEKLGDLCAHFATINEALPYTSNGYRRGTWPPFRQWSGVNHLSLPGYTSIYDTKSTSGWRNVFAYFRVLRQLARAHNLAYDAIKKVRPDADVSIVHHVILFHANKNPLNKLLAWFANWHWTYQHIGRVYRKCDSIGLNYYMHKKFGETRTYAKTDMGWDVYPEGIHGALMLLSRYRKPLYVSEAGIADEDDDIRPDYIRRQVEGTWCAIQDGADVRGHLYWSFMDNYELAQGYDKRFGIIEIDYNTLKRKVRPSAYVYKRICESNALVE